MAAYNKCLQITFILVQILFVAFGGVMVGVGAWLEVQERSIVAAIEEEAFLAGPYLIIAAGCAIVLVAIIGLIGALCDKKINRFLLIFYIVLVLVIFVAQLVGGILGFVYRDLVMEQVQTGLNNTLSRYGTTNTTFDEAVTTSWNFIQERFGCCGVTGVENWIIHAQNFEGSFPSSCCMQEFPSCNTNNSTVTDQIFAEGCVNVLSDFVREQLLIVAAIGIAFVVGEIVVVLMAFCLVCCTEFDD